MQKTKLPTWQRTADQLLRRVMNKWTTVGGSTAFKKPSELLVEHPNLIWRLENCPISKRSMQYVCNMHRAGSNKLLQTQASSLAQWVCADPEFRQHAATLLNDLRRVDYYVSGKVEGLYYDIVTGLYKVKKEEKKDMGYQEITLSSSAMKELRTLMEKNNATQDLGRLEKAVETVKDMLTVNTTTQNKLSRTDFFQLRDMLNRVSEQVDALKPKESFTVNPTMQLHARDLNRKIEVWGIEETSLGGTITDPRFVAKGGIFSETVREFLDCEVDEMDFLIHVNEVRELVKDYNMLKAHYDATYAPPKPPTKWQKAKGKAKNLALRGGYVGAGAAASALAGVLF